jgi:hypothetical protein
VLLAAGLTLLALAAIGVLLVGPSHHRAASPPATTTTTTTTAPPPPAGPQVSAGPYSATITWHTDTPTQETVAWGPAGVRPLLWAQDAAPVTDHSVTLDGLTSSTAYAAQVDGKVLRFASAAAPSAVDAAVGDGVMRVNGGAFFPFVTWEECPDRWQPELAQGIDLFAGNPCTGLSSLLTAVNGHALAAGTSDDTPGTTGSGLVGWFYPDEADGRGLTAESLPAPGGAGLRFLTLTSHFYSGAAPLPGGRGMYPGLLAKADVIGFDIYPLQELCRPALLPDVFDSQQELVALAPGKPTFQWIEVREMKCPDPAAAVTQQTIAAESWLAIAGGAHGLGFFPPDWGAAVGATIHRVATTVRRIEPALLQPAVPVQVSPDTPSVRASARELGGAVYVIAVNAGTTPAAVTLTEPSLGDRTVDVLGSAGETVTAQNGAIAVTLPPLTAQIYVAPPA